MQDILIEIEDKEIKATFDKDNANGILINDKPYSVELLNQINKNNWSVAVNNKIYQIRLDYQQNGTALAEIDGITFAINITNERRKKLEQLIQKTHSSQDGGLTKILAPMPGMVVKVLASDGEKVNKGDGIIIIEAMKMENALKAPKTGIIRNIKAVAGIAVEKGALLMEIETTSP